MRRLEFWYRHPPLPTGLSALLVLTIQLGTTYVLLNVGRPRVLGLTPVTNDVPPVPWFMDVRLGLAVTVATDVLLLVFAAKASRLMKLALGLLVGGTLSNAMQLVINGWVLDWIPLPHLAMMSPGDIALAAGVALLVIAYFSDSNALPSRFSRTEMLVIGFAWAGFSVLAGARHHFVAAGASLSVFVLAWTTRFLVQRGGRPPSPAREVSGRHPPSVR